MLIFTAHPLTGVRLFLLPVNRTEMNIECYENIIGFTQQDCDCTITGRMADYNVSRSGIYLDELKPLDGLVGLTGCDETLWDALAKARTAAVTTFISDTNALLTKVYKVKRTPYKGGTVGEAKPKDVFINRKNYAVLRIACAPVKGGVLRIKSLSGIFTATGTVTVQLYSNLDGLISSHDIATIAGKLSTTSLSIELPTYSKYLSREGLEYYLVYQFDPANMPYDNEINCGCGGWIPSFDKSYPYYNHIGKHRGEEWGDWCMVGGHEINSLTELTDLAKTANNKTFGLVVELQFHCKVDEVLCEEQLDFQANPLALSMAYAVQFKTAFNVCDFVLQSLDLTRESMVNNESIMELQMYCGEKYKEHVNYIVQQADVTANDCLSCKEGFVKITRQGLLS